jgi:hypothetical protein
MSTLTGISSDTIYLAIRSAIESETQLEEAYDPMDLVSDSQSNYERGGFIVEIETSNSNSISEGTGDLGLMYLVTVRVMTRRLGDVATDKSTILGKDAEVRSALYSLRDSTTIYVTYEYIRSTNPTKFNDDYLTISSIHRIYSDGNQ